MRSSPVEYSQNSLEAAYITIPYNLRYRKNIALEHQRVEAKYSYLKVIITQHLRVMLLEEGWFRLWKLYNLRSSGVNRGIRASENI